MGYSYYEFWDMNPRILESIIEGYKLKRKIIDEEQWLLGGYVFDAVSIALGNAFKKRGCKPDLYFEVIKDAKLKNIQNGDVTEEEKQKRLDLLMAGLRIKQANFEISRKKKGR